MSIISPEGLGTGAEGEDGLRRQLKRANALVVLLAWRVALVPSRTFPSGPSWYRVYSQTWTLAPSAFHDETLWSFVFLLGSGANSETFAGDLYVLGAEVE